MSPIKVSELRAAGRNNGIPKLPGVYKWWCSKETLKYFIKQISSFSSLSGVSFQISDQEIESQIEHKNFPELGMTLYCFYVGKANANNGLRSRIISNHIKGNVVASTLRKTIYSLEYGYYDRYNDEHKRRNKSYVNEILDSVYVEWQDYEESEVELVEKCEINSHLRIFNIKLKDLDDCLYQFDVGLRHAIINNVKTARNMPDGNQG